MSKGFFTDKTSKPVEPDIQKAIGEAVHNWNFLSDFLINELKAKGEYKFYGVNYGWALRYNKSGKSVIALYPGKDGFTIQIILNKNQVDAALSNDLDARIIQKINNTESICEGKWVYLQIDKDSNVEDIIKLLKIRTRIK